MTLILVFPNWSKTAIVFNAVRNACPFAQKVAHHTGHSDSASGSAQMSKLHENEPSNLTPEDVKYGIYNFLRIVYKSCVRHANQPHGHAESQNRKGLSITF